MRKTPLHLIHKIRNHFSILRRREEQKTLKLVGRPPVPDKPYKCPYLDTFYNLARFGGKEAYKTLVDINASVDLIRFSREEEVRQIWRANLVEPSKRDEIATRKLLNEVIEALEKLPF